MSFKKLLGLAGTVVILFWLEPVSCRCQFHVMVPPSGVITSPKYPNPISNDTYCTWYVESREKGTPISLVLEDLDIEADEPEMCDHREDRRCCKNNWLSLPMSGSLENEYQQLCGVRMLSKPITVLANQLTIRLHVSKTSRLSRGFRLAYGLAMDFCSLINQVSCGPNTVNDCYDPATQRCDGVADCKSGLDELSCPACLHSCHSDGKCYPLAQHCNGRPDCNDFSDELNCGFCKKGNILCSPNELQCYNPEKDRCDGKFDCPHGEDEVGCVPTCPKKIACLSGEGCYTSSQRCDSLSDCLDSSDESMCPRELCSTMHNKRLCRNYQCLPSKLWCDGSDDCGDNSDEEDCLKNSIIALAIIGSLFCGILLVVAVGCAFRMYGPRVPGPSNYHLHISPHIASRLRMAPVTLPVTVNDDFFLREPPPAYSVAVGETDVNVPNAPLGRPRRQRRQRMRRITPPQVVVKPIDPVPSEACSSQSSPSRGSVTSSGTDDTVLVSL